MRPTTLLKSAFLICIFFVCRLNLLAQATLPVSATFTSTTSTSPYFTMPTGFTNSLLTGYTGSLKFPVQASWLLLNYSGTAETLTFELGVNNTFPGTLLPTMTFTVEQSTDGTTFTTLATYTNVAGGVKTISNINSSSKYIRWIYTVKPIGYNVALKNINLTASNTNVLALSTQSASSVASTTATLNGNITSFDNGSAFVNAYGFCWNTTGTPTIADSKVDKGYSSRLGAYTHNVSGLSPFTTYYVRAYATNASGVTTYGSQVSFTTTTGLSSVSTQAATAIASTTATLNGTISSLGDSPVTAHGFCWNTSSSPTISNSKTDLGTRNATGTFTSNINSLLPSTTYYVRSYATNSAGTTYGSEVNFTTTSGLATMSTQAATTVKSTTAQLNGTIVSFDSSTPFVNSYGFCWNTTGTPTILDAKVDKGFSSATGAYSHSISNLSPSTTYYVRAYALNEAGTPSYGAQISFTTTTGLATVTTSAASSVISTSASLSGSVSSLGDSPVTSHGFCWNTVGTPTTSNSKIELGDCLATGAISSPVTGLSPNTKYYVRVYATNSSGTTYGSEINFTTTTGLGSLSTQAATSILSTSAVFNATLLSLGDTPALGYGFCWNTSGSPTLSDQVLDNGVVSALGTYNSQITGLTPNTTYYVRPFITNGAGTAYGAQIQFTTPSGLPIVSTQVASSVSSTSATLNGTVSGEGDTSVTSYGFCWSTSGIPTISDIKIDKGSLVSTGSYSHNLTNLEMGRVYYVRAFATNSKGTSYGSLQAFQTLGVVLNVTVPLNTKECWVAGNFNSWTADQLKMSKVDTTHYTITLDETNFPVGVTRSNLEYKYNSGPNWIYVEKDANGFEIANRNYSTSDVVASWAQIFVPSRPAVPGVVTFNAIVPESVERCYVLGSFNNWANPVDSTKMSRGVASNGQVTFTKTLAVSDINTLQYRFCAGPDWSYEQLDPLANFSYTSSNMTNSVYSFKSIFINLLPDSAGVISGLTTVCQGESAITYTVPTINRATSYSWTLPGGVTGSSSTNSITVDYSPSASSGNITVKGVNGYGNGPESSLNIVVNQLPVASSGISGSTSICAGQTSSTYTVPEISNASSYEWTLPSGASGSSTGNTILVDFDSNFSSGTISVRGVNSCGYSSSVTISISKKDPIGVIDVISGVTSVCQQTSGVTYSVPAVSNATSYTWLLPTGVTGSSTTNTINADFGSDAQSGNIVCRATNGCEYTQFASMAVTVNVKPVTPFVSILSNGGGYYLHSSSSIGNQWYNSNGLIDGATSQNLISPQQGTYYVVVNGEVCSSDVSNSVLFIATENSASDLTNSVKIYPNPAKDIVHVSSFDSMQKIEIYDLSGRIVKAESCNSLSRSINVNTLRGGVYVVKTYLDGGTSVQRLIKE